MAAGSDRLLVEENQNSGFLAAVEGLVAVGAQAGRSAARGRELMWITGAARDYAEA
jgi:hypothetical protein